MAAKSGASTSVNWGPRVRAMREKLGSRAELARELKVSPLTLSLWEQGDHAPRQQNEQRLRALESRLARDGNRRRPTRRTNARKTRGRVAPTRRRSGAYHAEDIDRAAQRLLEVLRGAPIREVARINPQPLADLSKVLASLDELRARYEEWGDTPWTQVEVQ